MKDLETYEDEIENQKLLYSSGIEEIEMLSKPPDEKRRRKIMIALWDKLTQFWPQWESLYGDVNGPTIFGWHRVLNQFTEENIAGAVSLCEDWTGNFPPSLPEFKRLCSTAKSTAKPNFTEQRLEDEKADVKSIEDLSKPSRADGPIAKREKKRMRQILDGKEIETVEESLTVLSLHRR